MSVQHKSLRDEILFVIGRSNIPLDSGQIYERCTLAEEIKRVSDALWILRNDGKIAFAAGEGRRRYVLASGVAAPAPAGKAGRPADAGALPVLDIPTLADPGISLQGKAGKARRTAVAVTVDPSVGGASAPMGASVAGKPAPTFAADHLAGAGKMIHLPDVAASAARLADAMLAKSRAHLRQPAEPAPLRWWIDQDGGVELAHQDAGDTITLSAHQAARLAEMVFAAHAVLELS